MEVVEERFEIVKEDGSRGVDAIGIPTVFSDITHATGGWRNDEMYIIASATGGGKSSFLLGELIHTAKQGATSLYLSLEMSSHLLALRLLSAATGVPAMNIEKGNLKPETMERIREAADEFNNLPIYFYDRGVTTLEWHSVLTNHKNMYGLDIAAVDYLALMRDKGNSPYERVTNISLALRGHAKDFNIPYLVASQLNRASLSSRPTLSALKESGQVENDAGCVIFPYRLPREDDDDLNYDRAEIIIAKNRHGPVGTIPARFYLKQMMWTEPTYEIIEPPLAKRDQRSIS